MFRHLKSPQEGEVQSLWDDLWAILTGIARRIVKNFTKRTLLCMESVPLSRQITNGGRKMYQFQKYK